MNEKLTKSPLTYVLMQVKISQVLDIDGYIPKIQEKIRKDFPLYKALNFHAVEIKQGDKQPEFQSFTQWHFNDKESLTGIIVSRDALVIHTTKYVSFELLSEIFGTVLDILKSILDISLSTRVGIRYNNFISEKIATYINPYLQGFHLNKQGFAGNYFSRTESIQNTEYGGTINIRSVHFSDKNVFPLGEPMHNIFVMPELWQGSDLLVFDHHKKLKSPTNDFLLLDIDNYINKQADFDSKNIVSILNELHKDIYVAFRNAVTEEALRDWK